MISRTKKSIISLILVIILLMSSFPFGILKVYANETTAIYIVDTIGGESKSVKPDENNSGSGWTWNASQKVLTLNGFNGEYIEANGDLTIKLVGTNTITIPEGTTGMFGIKTDFGYGKLTIDKTSSDTTDKLIVQGTNIETGGLIYGGGAELLGGTVDVIVNNSNRSGVTHAIYENNGGIVVKNTSHLNITMNATGSDTSSLIGASSLSTSDEASVQINIKSQSYACGVSTLDASTGSCTLQISCETTDPESVAYATNGMLHLNDTNTIIVDKGRVSTGSSWANYLNNSNKNRIETKNHSKEWIIIPLDDGHYRNTFVDKATGLAIEDGLTFTPQLEAVPFEFVDSDLLDIPEGRIGDRLHTSYNEITLDILRGALKGVNQSKYGEEYTFELIDGTLPTGINLEYGYISGKYTEECPAGNVTIKATRLSDSATDTITIHYGKVEEPDRNLIIGSDTINMKYNNSGTGWNWNASTKILTLNGYDNGPIASEIGLDIVLSGTNMITVPSGEGAYAIKTNFSDGRLTINKTFSDTTDKLIVTAENVTSNGLLYGGGLELLGGTLEMSVHNTENLSSSVYAIYENNCGLLLENNSNLLIDMRGTDDYTYSMNGVSSLTTDDEASANITIQGQGNVCGISTFDASSGGCTVQISCETNNSESIAYATNGLLYLNDTNIIIVDKGRVSTGSSWSNYLNNANQLNIQPKNNSKNWIIIPIYEGAYRNTFVDKTTGEPIEDGLTFTPQLEMVPFSFTDSDWFDLPDGKVGESLKTKYNTMTIDILRGGIKGANQSRYNSDYTLEIIDGTLPKGLQLEFGYIKGVYEEECNEGNVTFRATRISDNATAEFTIHYGKVTVPLPIESVTLNKHEATIEIGIVETLTAEVLPDNATIKDVEWSTNNYAVARVNENGKVVGYSAGKATITATTVQGLKSDSCDIYVRERRPQVYANYTTNQIVGFTQPGGYKITGDDIPAYIVEDGVTSVTILDEWYGKILYVYKLGEYTQTMSLPQWVYMQEKVNTYSMNIYDTDLGAADEDYNPDDFSKSIYFVNTSNVEIDPAQVLLVNSNDDIIPYFNTGAGMLAAGGGYTNYSVFHAKPKAELAIGNYETTVELLYDIDDDGVYETNLGSGKITFKVRGPLPFTDIEENRWYIESVRYVYEHNLMTGLNPTTFGPNEKVTRGQIVTILYRDAGSPSSTYDMSFSDVTDSTKWYYDAVRWAAENGIVTGYMSGPDTGKFKPNDNITREQLAVILQRYAAYVGKDDTTQGDLTVFSDYKDVSNYALEGMRWAVGVGIIKGNADGTLKPKGTATRAEAATMIMRFKEDLT